MDVDNCCEGRFLLVGSRDCTVSVFDLDMGSDDQLQGQDSVDQGKDGVGTDTSTRERWKRQHRYQSIAKSRRIPPSAALLEQQSDPNYLARGHSHAGTVGILIY